MHDEKKGNRESKQSVLTPKIWDLVQALETDMFRPFGVMEGIGRAGVGPTHLTE